MSKVLVDKDALKAVLTALNGHSYQIGELQAMRRLSKLTGEKASIDQLIEDYTDPANHKDEEDDDVH